jgi:hypothetical protein
VAVVVLLIKMALVVLLAVAAHHLLVLAHREHLDKEMLVVTELALHLMVEVVEVERVLLD